uniref:Putative secreted protein n=1 Tax=Ixodes ricinus TaxID=34613 RepID=A0A6B0UQJ6_IXORI
MVCLNRGSRRQGQGLCLLVAHADAGTAAYVEAKRLISGLFARPVDADPRCHDHVAGLHVPAVPLEPQGLAVRQELLVQRRFVDGHGQAQLGRAVAQLAFLEAPTAVLAFGTSQRPHDLEALDGHCGPQ